MDIELYSSPCNDPGDAFKTAAPQPAPTPAPAAARRVWPAMVRGALGKCPNCGEGRIFRAYLKVVESCAHCGQELHHHRADDAPPYFTIFISGHVIIPLMILVERYWAPAIWIHMAMWLPLTLFTCMALLPPIKGALVGLQWALRMHGFAGDDDVVPGTTSMDSIAP